jgi:hypothetical protein
MLMNVIRYFPSFTAAEAYLEEHNPSLMKGSNNQLEMQLEHKAVDEYMIRIRELTTGRHVGYVMTNKLYT